jgi:hypothetical protein
VCKVALRNSGLTNALGQFYDLAQKFLSSSCAHTPLGFVDDVSSIEVLLLLLLLF